MLDNTIRFKFVVYATRCLESNSYFIHYCRVFKLSEILDLLEAGQLITMDVVQQVKQFLRANETVVPPKPPLAVK